jgi:hypothetical protein
LRNFVEPGSSEKAPHGSDSGIFIIGPCGTSIGLRVGAHGAKLVAIKNGTVSSNAFLMIEEASGRSQLDGEGYERK